jgi:hypothetical protein
VNVRWAFWVAIVNAASCGGGTPARVIDAALDAPPDSPPPVDDPTNPDVPPRGDALLTPWLAAGYYKDWTCEPAVHPPEYPSNHGDNRTCNNSILHTAPPGVGNFPLNAASVKEMYADDDVTILGYAVSRKINDNLGDGWYWYQKTAGSGVTADGMADAMVSPCYACHQCAPRDFTFAVVQ